MRILFGFLRPADLALPPQTRLLQPLGVATFPFLRTLFGFVRTADFALPPETRLPGLPFSSDKVYKKQHVPSSGRSRWSASGSMFPGSEIGIQRNRMRRRRRIHFFPILVDEEHVHLHLDKIFVVRLPSVPLFRLMILLGAMAAASQLVSCSLIPPGAFQACIRSVSSSSEPLTASLMRIFEKSVPGTTSENIACPCAAFSLYNGQCSRHCIIVLRVILVSQCYLYCVQIFCEDNVGERALSFG